MTQLTDQLEATIAARQTFLSTQADSIAATEIFYTANGAFESAKSTLLDLLPPEPITYEYTDTNNNVWAITRDEDPNPSVALRLLNPLPS